MKKLQLVVSCTARKRAVAATYPRLGVVDADSVVARARAWARLIADQPREAQAADLYAGEYWRVAMAFADGSAQQRPTSVSVISAGLGLIDSSDTIPMYGATFSRRHPDSVVGCTTADASADRRAWWGALASSDDLGPSVARRLADLHDLVDDGTVVVCVGRDYLDAVAEDLLDLSRRLTGTAQLLIFGSGRALQGMEAHWITVPGSLRLVLGGSLASTGLRAAQAVIADRADRFLTVEEAREAVFRLAADAGSLPRLGRTRLGDGSILDWLAAYLAGEPDGTKSAALRQFRAEGKACEQARFGQLFNEARESLA